MQCTRTWYFVSVLLTTVQVLIDVLVGCRDSRSQRRSPGGEPTGSGAGDAWSTHPRPVSQPARQVRIAGRPFFVVSFVTDSKLETWANAQRDGRPAEYRWHPLFNAAKFG